MRYRIWTLAGALALSGCIHWDGGDDPCDSPKPSLEEMWVHIPGLTDPDPDELVVAPGGEVEIHVNTFDWGFAGDGSEYGEGCAFGYVYVYLDSLAGEPLAVGDTEEVIFNLPEDTAPGEHNLIGRLHDQNHDVVLPQQTFEVVITVINN